MRLEAGHIPASQGRRVLLQFGAHRIAAVERSVRQRDTSLLDLAAQGDGALAFRLASLLQSGAAFFAQRVHPYPPTGALDLAVEPPRDFLEAGFPRPQPISSRELGVIELL